MATVRPYRGKNPFYHHEDKHLLEDKETVEHALARRPEGHPMREKAMGRLSAINGEIARRAKKVDSTMKKKTLQTTSEGLMAAFGGAKNFGPAKVTAGPGGSTLTEHAWTGPSPKKAAAPPAEPAPATMRSSALASIVAKGKAMKAVDTSKIDKGWDALGPKSAKTSSGPPTLRGMGPASVGPSTIRDKTVGKRAALDKARSAKAAKAKVAAAKPKGLEALKARLGAPKPAVAPRAAVAKVATKKAAAPKVSAPKKNMSAAVHAKKSAAKAKMAASVSGPLTMRDKPSRADHAKAKAIIEKRGKKGAAAMARSLAHTNTGKALRAKLDREIKAAGSKVAAAKKAKPAVGGQTQTGRRGGVYYMGANGKKVYVGKGGKAGKKGAKKR